MMKRGKGKNWRKLTPDNFTALLAAAEERLIAGNSVQLTYSDPASANAVASMVDSLSAIGAFVAAEGFDGPGKLAGVSWVQLELCQNCRAKMVH